MINYPDLKPIALVAELPEWARIARNNAEIRKWCRQYTLIDERQHEKWLARQSDDPTIKMFGVDLQGTHIGVCGLTSIDLINRNAEFSLYLNPYYHGKGYGEKALISLLRHGFNDFGLHRIWGETFDGNPAMNLFKKVGMTVEGTQRQAYFREGEFIDCHTISILRQEMVWPQ